MHFSAIFMSLMPYLAPHQGKSACGCPAHSRPFTCAADGLCDLCIAALLCWCLPGHHGVAGDSMQLSWAITEHAHPVSCSHQPSL